MPFQIFLGHDQHDLGPRRLRVWQRSYTGQSSYDYTCGPLLKHL